MRRILLYIMCIATATLSAQTLSLDSCLSLALQNNRELQSSQKLAEKYRYDEKSYKANFFPNFKFMANDIYSNSRGTLDLSSLGAGIQQSVGGLVMQLAPALMQMGIDPTKLNMQMPDIGLDWKVGNVVQAGITVEQPIYMGGKVSAAYRMSKIGRQMAELGVQLKEDEVIVATEEAYSLVVKATELNKVAAQYDELLSTLLRDVQNAEKHGLRGHNDVLKVQVKKSEAELQVRQAENAIKLAKMNLCHCIGLPLDSEISVEPQAMFVGTYDLRRASGVEERPEYNVLQLKSDLAAENVKLSRSDFLPQVGLMAGYSYMDGVELADKKFFRKPGFGVVLNVSVPIYHANEAQNKVRSAKIEHERAVLEQQDLIEKMNLELAQAANILDECILEVEMTEKAVQQAEDNLKSSRKSFDVGLESLSEFLEAQTLWQQAKATQIDAHSRLFLANTKYLKAAGKL